jgi:hypothetical protein
MPLYEESNAKELSSHKSGRAVKYLFRQSVYLAYYMRIFLSGKPSSVGSPPSLRLPKYSTFNTAEAGSATKAPSPIEGCVLLLLHIIRGLFFS